MLLGEQRGVGEPSEEEQTFLPSHGLWIALATFVPTFLAIVIGVPHVLTFALAPNTIDPRVPVVPRSATTASATPTGWSADLRSVFLARSVPSGMEGRGRPTPLVDSALKPAPAEDSAWTPAAAFSDNQTAARLASTMRNQGYRVDVRHEDAAARPWVVWIKANPQKPKGG